MRRRADDTRRQILDAAYELFHRKGLSRVSVDDIAAAARFTKRTLYYHFETKDALLAAVMETQRELAFKRIERWAAQLSGDVETFLDGLFAELAKWSARPRWQGAGFTRIVMELVDLPGHPVHAIASRHKQEIGRWLAGQFRERGVSDADQLARETMLLLEGCMAMMLIHRDRRYAITAAGAAKRLASLSTEPGLPRLAAKRR